MSYLGIDVLTAISDGTSAETEGMIRGAVLRENPTGLRSVDLTSDDPKTSQSMNWAVSSHAEGAVLRAFLKARRGRSVPFWYPTVRLDLVLYEDIDPTGGAVASFKVWDVKYRARMFVTSDGRATGARRHLCLWAGKMAITHQFKVTAATHSGSDPFEVLTVTPSIAMGALIPKTRNLSFMRYCRMDNDKAMIAWQTNGVGTARMMYREIPTEAVT